ncbi:MAG: hypothetical protein ABH952_02940 [Candidatus Omnitrophota bacterium]
MRKIILILITGLCFCRLSYSAQRRFSVDRPKYDGLKFSVSFGQNSVRYQQEKNNQKILPAIQTFTLQNNKKFPVFIDDAAKLKGLTAVEIKNLLGIPAKELTKEMKTTCLFYLLIYDNQPMELAIHLNQQGLSEMITYRQVLNR